MTITARTILLDVAFIAAGGIVGLFAACLWVHRQVAP